MFKLIFQICPRKALVSKSKFYWKYWLCSLGTFSRI